MIEKREFYINGAWVAPLEPRDCAVIDPSTEEPCAVISLGGGRSQGRLPRLGRHAPCRTARRGGTHPCPI